MKLFFTSIAVLSFIVSIQALDSYPFPCQKTYSASAGDTFQSIASKHGISQDQLISWTQNFYKPNNPVKNGDLFCTSYSGSNSKRGIRAHLHRGDIAKPTQSGKKAPKITFPPSYTPTPQYIQTMTPMYY
ncbi:unnamed protein product [Rhizopus stolonifer]